MKIIGELPAREGSKRVPRKNLRLLEGKPLITYALGEATRATMLHEVYVNSDSDAIGELAVAHGARFYKRPPELGSDTTTQDEFNYDFIRAIKPDVLVMINPVAPLTEASDIDRMLRYFLEAQLDTLVPVREEYAHAFYRGQPVNCNVRGRLERTQDLSPIQLCAWTVGIWRAETFVKQYEEHGYAAFSGKIGFYPLNRFKTVKISTEEDFLLAEILVKSRHRWQRWETHEGRERIGRGISVKRGGDE